MYKEQSNEPLTEYKKRNTQQIKTKLALIHKVSNEIQLQSLKGIYEWRKVPNFQLELLAAFMGI